MIFIEPRRGEKSVIPYCCCPLGRIISQCCCNWDHNKLWRWEQSSGTHGRLSVLLHVTRVMTAKIYHALQKPEELVLWKAETECPHRSVPLVKGLYRIHSGGGGGARGSTWLSISFKFDKYLWVKFCAAAEGQTQARIKGKRQLVLRHLAAVQRK